MKDLTGNLIGIIGASLLISLAGCGTQPINKEFSIDSRPAPSISLDAQQRTILVTDQGGPVKERRKVVCAEPSPDAIVTSAASLGAKLSVLDKGNVGVESSLAQAFSEMGTRTPVIQLLRDGLYRACEAYMNGVVGEDEYGRIVRHYDSTMVALVAVDGLTRCTFSPGGTKASADSSSTQNAGETGHATAESVSRSAVGNCQISPDVAEKVRVILDNYWTYKAPLHRSFCKSGVVKQLIELRKTDSTVPLENALGFADAICDAN